MELGKFTGVQGAFLSVQKSINSLNSIESGDKESIDFVTKRICKAVKSEDFENDDLQGLMILLFLNTDTGLYQQLKNDGKCSYLVGFIPMISRHLLVKLILYLKLEPYLCNSIIFIEGKVCHHLLSISEICIKMLDEFEAIVFVENLAKALYRKLSFSEDSHVKLFFHSLLKHYDEPSIDRLTSVEKWEKTKVYHFTGLIMDSLLSLLHDFLEFYYENNHEKPKGHSVFELFNSYEDNPEISNLNKTVCVNKNNLLECCNLLISKCSSNMVAVTLDVYLHWVEIDLDNVPDTDNTLQRKICEKAYKCNISLVEAEKLGVFSSQTSELINYLTSIASKPHIDQQCEQSEIDISTIIQNINDPESNVTEWLEKLLLTPFEFTDDIVELLIKNVMFLNHNCRKELFKKGLEFANRTENCPECVKELILQIVNQEKVDYQVKFLKDFLQEYGLKKILRLNDFKKLCTATFNKAVNDETKCKEMYSLLISLAMQDGETVIKTAVKLGIRTELQGKQMADILNLLSPVCCMSTTTIGSNESPLLLHTLEIMCQKVTKMADPCKINFPLFVKELVERNLIDGSLLISNTILPLMDNSQMNGSPSEVVVHSVCLDLITVLVKLGTKITNSVVLRILVDVLNENRCQIHYSSDMMTVCEKTISLIDLLVCDCIQNPDNFEEKAWLKEEMKHYKQMNSGHLAKLFPEDQKPNDDLADSLFYMMHRGTEGWSLLDLDVDTKTNISIVFSSILVSLTRSEWEMMFQMFAPDNVHFIELFLIVSQSALLFKTIVDSYNCINSGETCLVHCILTTASITNQTMALWDEINHEGTAKVFLRFCLMIKELSCTKHEQCSITLTQTLIDLLKIICQKKPINDSILEMITVGIYNLNVIHVRKAVIETYVEIIYRGNN